MEDSAQILKREREQEEVSGSPFKTSKTDSIENTHASSKALENATNQETELHANQLDNEEMEIDQITIEPQEKSDENNATNEEEFLEFNEIAAESEMTLYENNAIDSVEMEVEPSTTNSDTNQQKSNAPLDDTSEPTEEQSDTIQSNNTEQEIDFSEEETGSSGKETSSGEETDPFEEETGCSKKNDTDTRDLSEGPKNQENSVSGIPNDADHAQPVAAWILENKKFADTLLNDNSFFTAKGYHSYSVQEGFSSEQEQLLQKAIRLKEINAGVSSAMAESDDLKFVAQAAIEEMNEIQDAPPANVFDTLEMAVDKDAKEWYSIERKRAFTYPRFYKYYNQLKIQPKLDVEKHILSFKKMLLKTGQVTRCIPEAFTTPKRLNVFKSHFVTGENQEDYYQKKIPPVMSSDVLVHDLLKQTHFDIVISTCCLLKLAEMQNDFSVSGHIPLIMKQDGNKKTLYFDRPLPNNVMTAQERNKLVNDVCFKSLCLDWPNRYNISSSKQSTISNSANGWNYNDDENLQYTHWEFGDMNLLIRHQVDGDVFDSTEKTACLVSKLDYQTQDEKEVTRHAERVMNWLRSYLGGHSIVIEGRVDVVNNSLIKVDKKQMVDIMNDEWKPISESEMLRQTLLNLHKSLEPGSYLLHHKANDKHFCIYSSVDQEESSNTLDLHEKYKLNEPLLNVE